MAYIKLEDLQKFPIRMNHYDKEHGNEHFVYGVESVLEYAEYLPKVDVVEVRHGRWEIVKGSNGKEKMVCTNCRHQQDLYSTFTYCPNCGAKMDGKKVTDA